MSFPFPKNPTDGQVVTQAQPDGSILTATYRQVKNEWELARQSAPGNVITSGAPPAPIQVTATADGQVVTWDQVLNAWVAKAPADAGGVGGTFVKATQVAADTSNPPSVGAKPLVAGMLQSTLENLHKEIKAWDGTHWTEVLAEDTIKQWISAGSLFRGVTKESTLATLPVPALANRGFYFSWTGAPGHVVSAADPMIGTDLAGEILQVGDWIQSDGAKWVHVPGDLLSKQRWDSLGGFIPWSDTSWEKGALVSYKGGFWRANALIIPGDDAPSTDPGNKWTDITPNPSMKLAELSDVNDNVAIKGEDGVLIWSEVDQEFVVSRTFNITGIEFDASGPGAAIEGIVQGDLALNGNLNTQVPSCESVVDYVKGRRLEDLADTKDLATAEDGELVAWDAATSAWVPFALPAQHFLGSMAAPPLGVNGGDVYYQNIISGTGSTAIQKGFYQWAGGVWSPLPKSETVASLLDVDLTTAPKDGEALAWDLKTLKWKPVGASATLKGLTDVNVAGVGDTNVLTYDYSQSKWIPTAATLSGRFLQDVNLRDKAVNSGDVLAWNGADNEWQNQSIGLDWLNDVEIHNKARAKDDLLQFDGTKWVNWKPNYLNDTTGYTKVQIDAKLTTLLQGVEHGLAVEALTNTPPATPAVDDLYIVGTVPTGAWVGHANELANWDGKAWQFEAARDKEAHLVEDQQATFHWNGTAWVKIATAIAGGTSAQAGVGEIVPWIGDNVPATDYLECIGQIVAVSIYPELHTAIGNKYNTGTAADGTTTFALPDLRGYFLRGDKAGLAVGTKQQWTTGRPRTSFTADSQGDHKHTQGSPVYAVETAYSYLDVGTQGHIATEQTWNQGGTKLPYTSTAGAHTHTITGGGDTETAPDHFAVKWLIRYKPINGGAKGDKGDKGLGVPATATAGDVLTYDGTTNAWIGKAAASPYPKLVANKTIEHHVYGGNNWEETTVPIADISRWIPTGHLYKLELDARLFAYHGGNAYLKTYFSGTQLYGNAAAQGDQVSVLSTVQTPHTGYSRHITGVNTTGGNLVIHFCSTTSAGNGDRQIFGEVLLWDLGPDSALPSLV